MVERVERENVIAFRLAAHHLAERLGEHDLLVAAGQSGVQNTPPGSALLAFHARVEGVTPELVTGTVEDKSMLLTWSMRGAPYYVPTSEADVFTVGVLPPTEKAKRHFVLGVEQSVDRLGMTLTETVGLVGAATSEVLSGRQLAINELGAEVAERIARDLPKEQREVWEEEGPHAKGQAIGEAVVHFCVRILALQRVVCFAPRTGNKAPFVLTEEWLGGPVDAADPEESRAELLRSYLRSYGPSTRADFAAWLGVQTGDVDSWWSLLGDELTQVDYGGSAWVLTADLDTLRSASMPSGGRMLPPRDPYLQMRDRGTIVDKKHHRDVWKTVGDPGAILVDGEIVGTWRPRKSGRTLHLEFETFDAVTKRRQLLITEEAGRIAPLRGASSVTVEFTTY